MEYGYDVDFPKIYDFDRRELSDMTPSNLLLAKRTAIKKGTYSVSQDRVKSSLNKVASKGSVLENRLSNLSTIVPHISSSNSNILEVDTLISKQTMSPYK